jgi:S1-C subfamily serine protease
MESGETLRLVLRDIVEAESLSIQETPLVLINGERVDDEQPTKAILAAIHAVDGSPTNAPATPTDWLPNLASTDRARETFSTELQASAISATTRIVNKSNRSIGSGVVIAIRPPFAYILTAYHVVARSDSFEVQTFSSSSYPQASRRFPGTRVIATSAAADLALVRIPIDNSKLPALPLCPLESLPESQPFVALSAGCTGEEAPKCQLDQVIGSKSVRKEAGSESRQVWEVTEELATGRSGGPLIDWQGRLLGIASGNSQGRGYYAHTAEIHDFLANSPVK